MPSDYHAELIVRLGGKAHLARLLGLGADAVTKWHVRGIPPRYWHRIEDIAHEAGLTGVTAEELERTKPGAGEPPRGVSAMAVVP